MTFSKQESDALLKRVRSTQEAGRGTELHLLAYGEAFDVFLRVGSGLKPSDFGEDENVIRQLLNRIKMEQ